MKPSQIISRRRTDAKVDFRPDDPAGNSPFAQLRRLSRAFDQDIAPAEDFEDMDDVLDAYKEYLYRKIFTNTSHEEYAATPPETVDWLIAVAGADQEHFRNTRKKES